MPTQTVQTWISPIKGLTERMLSAFFDTIVGSGPAAGSIHHALDIAVPVGTSIYAPRQGRVSKVEYQEAGGNVVTIDHADGWQTIYAHLDSVLVRVGDVVQQGEEFATSGATGAVTGPHLHWETKRNGVPVDPLDLFDPFEDTPDTAYSASKLEEFINFLKEQAADDIAQGKTWADWAGKSYQFGFFGAPGRPSAEEFRRALQTLGLWDEPIRPRDIPRVAAEALKVQSSGSENPLTGIGDAIGFAGDAIQFLLTPENWMRLMALLAGAVLAFVGFRMMWEATAA